MGSDIADPDTIRICVVTYILLRHFLRDDDQENVPSSISLTIKVR